MASGIKALFGLIGPLFRLLFWCCGWLFAPVSWLFTPAQSAHQRRAQRVAKQLLSVTKQQRLRTPSRDGKTMRYMAFDEPLLLTKDELWCPIHFPLPDGVSRLDIETEDVIKTMEAVIHARVRVDTLPTGKVCYVARIGEGGDFPEMFTLNSF